MPHVQIDDVVYGSTPIECRYSGMHPRLHFTAADLDVLRARLDQEPWRTFLAEIRECAENNVSQQAFLYALTGEQAWLDLAVASVTAFLDAPNTSFNSMYYMALCYDWLYHDLDPALKARLQEYLNTTGREEYESMALHARYESGVYGWNISAEIFNNLAAAGFALYGDVPNVAPWIRYVADRARAMTQALGTDGVSPEGISYGGFYTESYVKTLDLVQRLMGVDLFTDNAYLQNLPWFYAFSALPRTRMIHNNSALCLGDGATGQWYGPASFLHKVAACYGDSLAQWTADVYRAAQASAKGGSLYSLLWYDATVPAVPHTPMPLARHFMDKDIVFMRSDWQGDETIVVFKCGPHAGHHALRHYPQCIGGGHMAADAGTILVYAHGERIISDGGYAQKYTEFRNTVLVNGIGQTGACDGTNDWFECSDLRREKRGPSLLRADLSAEMDYLIGDVAPAYGPEARLVRYLRHLVYLRPETVILIDELTAESPATFELWFHADARPDMPAERPFQHVADGVWHSTDPQGHCRITRLHPSDASVEAGTQRIIGVGAHADFDIDTLRIRNAAPTNTALFITVFDVFAGGDTRALPELITHDGALSCRVSVGSRVWSGRLVPGQQDPAQPIIRDIAWE